MLAAEDVVFDIQPEEGDGSVLAGEFLPVGEALGELGGGVDGLDGVGVVALRVVEEGVLDDGLDGAGEQLHEGQGLHQLEDPRVLLDALDLVLLAREGLQDSRRIAEILSTQDDLEGVRLVEEGVRELVGHMIGVVCEDSEALLDQRRLYFDLEGAGVVVDLLS